MNFIYLRNIFMNFMNMVDLIISSMNFIGAFKKVIKLYVFYSQFHEFVYFS